MFVVSHPSSTTHTHILNVNSSVGSFRVKALPKETKNDEITSSNKHRTTKLAISNQRKEEAKQCAKIQNAKEVLMKVPNVETNNENLDDLKEENEEPNAKN